MADDSSPPPDPAAWHRLPVAFGGSGSEYFRIWIVNLLLILLTLGLYYPWARVRQLRYFYGSTTVGGQPLAFHGEPKRMLRGYLLAGALLLLYSVAGNVDWAAGVAAFLIVAAVWPALYRASQQFRLANTSWRGLRFHFEGSLRGAYTAVLPLFIPAGVALAAAPLLTEGAAPSGLPQVGAALTAAAGIATVLCFPLVLWLLKKYQHDHCALGGERTTLHTGVASFYGVAFQAIAFCLLPLAIGVVAAVVGSGGAWGDGNRAARAATVGVLGVGAFAAIPVVLFGVVPFVTARLQNLVWGRTRSEQLRFDSALRFWPLFGVTVANALLVIVTLGLYIPFARVAMARLRLQAVTAWTRQPPDALVAASRRRADDAAGEAAGDLFGIDIGL